MKKIILASSSPRRKNILKKLDFEFEIIPSLFDEVLDSNIFSYDKIEKLAYCKAHDIAEKLDYPALVIGADTVVVHLDEILGKPVDFSHAVEMLNRLSGAEHSVVTSVCVIDTQTSEKILISDTSFVEFYELTEAQIVDYVQTFKPFDKAGSYGIQELPKGFVKSVRGNFDNIIGLNPEIVLECFEKISYNINVDKY